MQAFLCVLTTLLALGEIPLVAGEHCRVIKLLALDGTLSYGVDDAVLIGEDDICWHIRSGRALASIDFNTTTFTPAGAVLRMYTSMEEVKFRSHIGEFDDQHSIPSSLVMTGSDEAVVRLSGMSPRTRLTLHYHCTIEAGVQLLSLRISPLWLTLWMGVWSVCLVACCTSSFWMFRARRGGGRSRRAGRSDSSDTAAVRSARLSQLLVSAQLMQRADEQSRQRAIESVEAICAEALRKLPTCAWSGDAAAVRRLHATASHIAAPASASSADADDEAATVAQAAPPATSSSSSSMVVAESSVVPTTSDMSAASVGGHGDDDVESECCLCMEAFQIGDAVRVLPCSHFFHEACIDRWFEALQYHGRTCPLCKRDPLDGMDLKLPRIPPRPTEAASLVNALRAGLHTMPNPARAAGGASGSGGRSGGGATASEMEMGEIRRERPPSADRGVHGGEGERAHAAGGASTSGASTTELAAVRVRRCS